LIGRLTQAAYGLAYYVRAGVWPLNLLPIYELPMLPLNWREPRFVVSAMAVLAGVVVILALARRVPALLVALACYLAFVLPVSGLLQTGPQLVADRYSYASLIGLAIIVAAAWSRWGLGAKSPARRAAAWIIALAIVAALGISTHRYAMHWRSSMALWTYTLAHADDHAFAHSLLGASLIEAGQSEAALPHYRRALALRPDLTEASYTLARTLFVMGNVAEAEQVARDGLRFDPENVTLQRLLAECLLSRRDWAGAVDIYQRVLQTQPDVAPVHANLGMALSEMGQMDAAIYHLQRAAALQPERPQTWIMLARLTWAHTRDAEQARGCLRQALQRDPRNADALQLMAEINATPASIR
jgi:tetratricopeptide (TPR) repeat protein